jgi:uncharacterized protein (TIRG00374 family)
MDKKNKTKKWPWFPGWLRVAVLVAIIAIIVWFVVVPQYGQASRAINSFKHISIPLVILAALLEVASLMSYSVLTAITLGRKEPTYFTLLRIDLTDLGVNHVVPGGGATAGAVRYRLLKLAGVPASEAIIVATIEIIFSNLILGIIFAIGILLSVMSFTKNQYYIVAGVFIISLFIVALAVGWILTRHTEDALRLLDKIIGRHISIERKQRYEVFIRKIAEVIRALLRSPKRIGKMAIAAALNWLFDAAALWIILAAFGFTLDLGSLLIAYGLANILEMLPLTPGGIGIVEGILVPSLVGFGVPGTVAIIAVVGWRLFEYWMPIPASLVSYLTLHFGVLRRNLKHRMKIR